MKALFQFPLVWLYTLLVGLISFTFFYALKLFSLISSWEKVCLLCIGCFLLLYLNGLFLGAQIYKKNQIATSQITKVFHLISFILFVPQLLFYQNNEIIYGIVSLWLIALIIHLKSKDGYARNKVFWFLAIVFFVILPLSSVFYALLSASKSSRLAATERQDKAELERLDLSAKVINSKLEQLKSSWNIELTASENIKQLTATYPDIYFRSTDLNIREQKTSGNRSPEISAKLINPEVNQEELTKWLFEEGYSEDYSHAFRLFVLSKLLEHDNNNSNKIKKLERKLKWELGEESTKVSEFSLSTQHMEALLSKEIILNMVNSSRALTITNSLTNTSQQAIKLNTDNSAWLMVNNDKGPFIQNELHSLIEKISYIALLWLGLVVLTLILYSQYKNKKAEEKLDIASTVAHEFRTPLTALSVMIEGLLEDTDKNQSKVNSYLTRMKGSTQQLKQISEHFFIEGSIKQKNLQLETQTWTSWLELKWQEFISLHQDKNINFINNIKPSKTTTYLDDTLLTLALHNLLRNAYLYTDEGSIHIESFEKSSIIGVRISDTGCGIGKEFQHKMYEKYTRYESSITRSKEGMGLGLYLVREIVKLHDGEISAKSELDQGTTFTLSIKK